MIFRSGWERSSWWCSHQQTNSCHFLFRTHSCNSVLVYAGFLSFSLWIWEIIKCVFGGGIYPIGFRNDFHPPPSSHAQSPWLKGSLKSPRISSYKALYLASLQSQTPLQPRRIVSASRVVHLFKKKFIKNKKIKIKNPSICQCDQVVFFVRLFVCFFWRKFWRNSHHRFLISVRISTLLSHNPKVKAFKLKGSWERKLMWLGARYVLSWINISIKASLFLMKSERPELYWKTD